MASEPEAHFAPELVYALLDETLSGPQRQRCRRHLRACRRCADAVAEARELSAWGQGLRRRSPWADAHGRTEVWSAAVRRAVAGGSARAAGPEGRAEARVGGPTLAEELRVRGPLAAHEVRRMAVELLRDLDRLQARGRVHGRVEAAQVERRDGRWRLAAPAAGAELPAGVPTTNGAARAPDAKSDLESLARTLYEALNGTQEGFPAPRAEHLFGAERRLYKRLYGVVRRACAPRAGEGFPSAAAMRRALRMPAGPVWAAAAGGLALALVAAVVWRLV